VPLRAFLLRRQTLPDEALIERYASAPGKVAGVLVGHTHFDHAVDAPAIARRHAAKAYGSPSLGHLMRLHGLGELAVEVVPHRPYQLGPFVVEFVPSRHGNRVPPVAAVDDRLLPARSAIITPDTELSDMFLTEAARGCSRGCTYCVMRRSTNGGMRIVPKELIFEKIPADVKKVGLVGAAARAHQHGRADLHRRVARLRPQPL